MSFTQSRLRRGLGAAIALFFLAPLVAEFLLGNLPITMLPALVMLAPMYGGGALLIRELVRRAGRGWPSIILLALAYGILEEAFTTQSLFNPNYLSLNLHLIAPAYIAALGIGGHWTVFVLTLHTAWSIPTPIALVEALVPDRAETPWLGRIGLSVTVLLFALGIAGTTLVSYRTDHFISSPGQFAASAGVIPLLVVAAFVLHPKIAPTATGWTPNPWVAGVLALGVGSAVLLIPANWGWGAAGSIMVLDGLMLTAVLVWGSRSRWTLLHKLALAGGAAMAYGWHAFVEKPVIGNNLFAARVGNVIFALAAVALIAFAAKRVINSYQIQPSSQSYASVETDA